MGKVEVQGAPPSPPPFRQAKQRRPREALAWSLIQDVGHRSSRPGSRACAEGARLGVHELISPGVGQGADSSCSTCQAQGKRGSRGRVMEEGGLPLCGGRSSSSSAC